MASTSWFDRLKTGVGLSAPEEPEVSGASSLLHSLDEASTLSRTQVFACKLLLNTRLSDSISLMCIAACLWLCHLPGTGLRLWPAGGFFYICRTLQQDLLTGYRCAQSSLFFLSPTRFAVLYTLANICSIGRYAQTTSIRFTSQLTQTKLMRFVLPQHTIPDGTNKATKEDV